MNLRFPFFRSVLPIATCLAIMGCGQTSDRPIVVTFPASAVGKEAELLRKQLDQFEARHPEIRVELRKTPDASDQRHQLYVQWLNAHAPDPDILQLDVVWTAEFSAAGWILPLDSFKPDTEDFFPATLRANRWQNQLFALPWFADVGMLYYRSDLVRHPPVSFEELTRQAETGRQQGKLAHGVVWQGARYEGLVCVFLEHLGGFGGQILNNKGEVVVDQEPAIRALTFMRDSVYSSRIVPESALTWKEEQTRFDFQNGGAVFLRNWPYAASLMQDRKESKVAGKFAVAPMPAAPGGSPTATLGGSQLAVNKYSEHPEAAYEVIHFLTQREQMLERAQALGQYPARRSVFDRPEMVSALAIPPQAARKLIENAVPRPVTPVYAELSEILQIWLHRALTRQAEPREALSNAAREMRTLLTSVELIHQ